MSAFLGGGRPDAVKDQGGKARLKKGENKINGDKVGFFGSCFFTV